MAGFLIWIFPVLVFVLFAIRQRGRIQAELDSGDSSIQIHKERLKNLQTQLESGELSEVEFESFKLEEEKALLADSEKATVTNKSNTQLPWLWVPISVAVVLLLSWFIYQSVGAYDAVNVRDKFQELARSSDFDSDKVNQALTSYQALLKSQPDNIEGWFRLSRMQMDMEQYQPAVDSLEHVLTQLRLLEHNAEDEATILAYIGQSKVALDKPEEALAAYEESLQYFQLDTAIGMAGRMAFELGDFKKAIDYWTRLKLNNPDGDVAVIDDFINQAKEQLSAQGIEYEEMIPVHVVVNIELPAAYEGLSQDAALFVYARPIGQRMPLAVKRLSVTGQSMVVMLSDADAMGPMGGISSQQQIEVTARISLTGIANTQPGDWAGNTEVVDMTEKENTVSITIEQP